MGLHGKSLGYWGYGFKGSSGTPSFCLGTLAPCGWVCSDAGSQPSLPRAFSRYPKQGGADGGLTLLDLRAPRLLSLLSLQ